jgi:hypothetical protein
MKILCTIVTIKYLDITQFEIKTTFLYVDFSKKHYVQLNQRGWLLRERKIKWVEIGYHVLEPTIFYDYVVTHGLNPTFVDPCVDANRMSPKSQDLVH